MTDNQSWQCLYCEHHQVLTEENHARNVCEDFVSNSGFGDVTLLVESIACLNPDCTKLNLQVKLGKVSYCPEQNFTEIKTWRLLPDSTAKPQPDYIPEHIRNDYQEACQIAHLSPKASATLARRCLHSILKDFCKINNKNLSRTIKQLKDQVENNTAPHGVTPDIIQAIDGVREMGNIGAHMDSKDGVIVDIDPNEAGLLIKTIELLFHDFYVTQYNRQKHISQLNQTVSEKIGTEKQAGDDSDTDHPSTEASQE